MRRSGAQPSKRRDGGDANCVGAEIEACPIKSRDIARLALAGGNGRSALSPRAGRRARSASARAQLSRAAGSRGHAQLLANNRLGSFGNNWR
jgi:hypothetical protein